MNEQKTPHTHEEHKHTHHHHHHHHRKVKRRRKENKFKRFLRHNKKTLLKVMWVLLVIILIVLIAALMDGRTIFKEDPPEESGNAVKETTSAIQLEIPFFTKEVSLVSPAVVAYMNAEDGVSISEILKKYEEDGQNRLDVGMPVTLSYAVNGIPDGYSVKNAKFVVSESADFFSSTVYTPNVGKTSVEIYHLKTATTYYYRVDLTLSNGSLTSASGSFKTADSPRILSVEGAYNLRDIGGWKTSYGKPIKQGLLYRGTELDGSVDPLYSITDNGVNTMLATLGIHTDMDLRFSADNKNGNDALGAGVNHIYYGAQMYSDVFEAEGKAAMREVFADLADPANYPIYLHCTQGLDRTGTVCYLLEAILGVSEEDLMREYQLSALHHEYLWALDQMEDFIDRLKLLEGDTMQEKAENYLLSIGVSIAEIESIRNIFLGE